MVYLTYTKGCNVIGNDTSGFNDAISVASNSNLTILVVGLNQSVESEGLDRYSLQFSGVQSQLISKVSSVSKETIVVIISGGCIDVSNITGNNSNINSGIKAILWSSYGGMYGGQAIADVIFGTFAPVGRLTQTWYKEGFLDQVSMYNVNMRPDDANKNNNNNDDTDNNNNDNKIIFDYSYNYVRYPGRGYRYYNGNEINYEFGFGLSYTKFECGDVDDSKINDQGIVSVDVTNVGKFDSSGVVLVFWIPNNAGMNGNENKRLIAFEQTPILLKLTGNVQVVMNVYQEFLNGNEFAQNKGKYKAGGICQQTN